MKYLIIAGTKVLDVSKSYMEAVEFLEMIKNGEYERIMGEIEYPVRLFCASEMLEKKVKGVLS